MKKIFTPVTELEKEKAFLVWHRLYELKDSDQQIHPFLEIDLSPSNSTPYSWLRKARTALFLSAQGVSEKLNITRSAYMQYEEKEIEGTIHLATLKAAAEAMDCELVYAIRPKARTTFSESIWKVLLPAATNHPWLKACDPKQKAKALSAMAIKFMRDPSFKRSKKWSQRCNEKVDSTK